MAHDAKAASPIPRDARAFFDAIARRYDRAYAISGPASRERMARVLEQLGPRRRVLVLGVGTGRELPALLDAGYAPTGLDVSPNMLARCQARSRTIPCVVADFWEPLPFPDASFDAVVALHGTIAHPRDEGSLPGLGRELVRVLVDDGRFVAEVPSSTVLAALDAGDGDAGAAMRVTGPHAFVHRDEATGAELAGVALDAEGWSSALTRDANRSGDRERTLQVHVAPLGEVEYLLVATVRRAGTTAHP